MIAVLLVALASPAPAAAPAPARTIDLHDLPGSDGKWTEGVAIVAAPPARVHEWLTDYARWKGRFPDMEWVEPLGTDAHGRRVVRFHSYAADRTFTLHQTVGDNLIVFDGWAPNVHMQGRIWILDAGGGRTRVVMQSSNEVHGLAGLFATRAYRRNAAFAATASQLGALLRLAATR
jgi:hypothetical protein